MTDDPILRDLRLGGAPPPRRRRRGLARVIYFVLAIVLLMGGWEVAGRQLVNAEERNGARDPETGVLEGARERDLGPADAPKAVLFIHGFVGAGDNFADLPDRLADGGWRVRVMRLPGHGTSPRDLKKVTSYELEQAVLEEVDKLRARHETLVLVGHSMGGALATLAAAQRDVDGLVLGAPYFGVTHRWYYGLRPETWTRVLSGPVRWVYKGNIFLQLNNRDNVDRITSYRVIPTKSFRMLYRLGDRAADPAVLEQIACPVLMLHSPKDVAASAEAAEQAFDRMGSDDKRLVWLERSNHHIFWDFDRNEVMREIIAFVDSIGSRERHPTD